MPTKILVAGAGGVLGRSILAELRRRGLQARAMVRRPTPAVAELCADVRIADALLPESLHGVMDGVDVVISSLGASVDPSSFRGWRRYGKVDAPANCALLGAAKRAGVRRFVYTSLIGGDRMRQLDYSDAHERVVDAMRASGLPASVLRPTGFFAAMMALLDFARRGCVPVFGDGLQPTNPIDEHDLAAIAVDESLHTVEGLHEVAVGGPEVFTRRQIAEMAFAALGLRPRLRHVPPWLARTIGYASRLVHPRVAHFTLFAAHVMTHPCLAPAVGTRRLADAFRRRAAELSA